MGKKPIDTFIRAQAVALHGADLNQVEISKQLKVSRCCQTNVGDGGKIGIWDGISDFGTTAAKIYMENMNGHLNCDVLQHELKQLITEIPNKTEMFFQQDLAPWHTSDTVKKKIAKVKLNVLDWAPKSSDLNPIEMLWPTLDKTLASKPIYARQGL
ncbi:unnamed protein product [Rotaria socialis]|uniref:Tc1-like transposase DDE domain-containing protein n=1 Tax=Rotaria socialis TaxID=392032 RepID=A0A821D9B9_9BILA|nr:unnamed protein product [Rotaria socialis]